MRVPKLICMGRLAAFSGQLLILFIGSAITTGLVYGEPRRDKPIATAAQDSVVCLRVACCTVFGRYVEALTVLH